MSQEKKSNAQGAPNILIKGGPQVETERTRQQLKYQTNIKIAAQSAPISPKQLARLNNSQEHITTSKILDNQRANFQNNASNTMQNYTHNDKLH